VYTGLSVKPLRCYCNNLEVAGMAEVVEGTVELEAEGEGSTAVAVEAALDQHTAAAAAAVADTDN